MKIELASEMLMEFDDGVRFKCRFVGLIKGECVIIRVPVTPGIRGRIEPGNELTFRYLNEGSIVSFTAVSQLYRATPYSLLFVDYPDGFEHYGLRKSGRIACRMRASLTKSQTVFEGLITDVSEGGCRFQLPKSQDPDEFVRKDDHVTGEFATLESGTVHKFRAKVARRRVGERDISLGLVFEEGKTGLSRSMSQYLDKIIEFQKLLDES